MIAPWLILLLALLGAFGVVLAGRRPANRSARETVTVQPRMLWPFAVVLLPLLALAGLAGWTLVLDRRSARDEVKARAGEVATGVLAALDDGLNVVQCEGKLAPGTFSIGKGRDFFIVNEQFELATPSPWVWPPPPAPLTAAEFAGLSTNKLDQWQTAEGAFARGEWTNAAVLYLAFLDERRTQGSEPMADFRAGIHSPRFRSLALFRRAQALEAAGQLPEAIQAYDDVLDGFVLGRGGLSESGLPLRLLAARKNLDLARGQFHALPETWRKQPAGLVNCLVNEPASPLADECIRLLQPYGPRLAESLGPTWRVEQLFDSWERAGHGRSFFAQAAAQQGTNAWPDFFWVNGPDHWLAARQTPPEVSPAASPGVAVPKELHFAVVPYRWLREEIIAAARRLDRRGDFRLNVRLGDMWFALPGQAATQEAPIHVQQSRLRGLGVNLPSLGLDAQANATSLLATVEVSLADSAAYSGALKRRQFLLVAVLLGAVAAGVAAAWALRRSLLKQLALNSQKSNFVSSVSHELRAPIASVRLLAESLERGTVREPAQQREYFRFIGQECRRLSALIENVLDFARIEQGRKQYEFEPTDLRALVATTVRLMEPMAAEKGVSLGAKMPDAGCRIPDAVVDGRAIQQALVNLLDNAIKHSPAGAVVEVKLEAAIPDAGCQMPDAGLQPSGIRHPASGIHAPSSIRYPRLLLSVADHGPGIPASEHQRIFERFHRLGSELRRETQGVGIGLSIVKHIIEAHGGCVRVESEPGRGSRFTIELPLHKSESRNPKSE